MSDVNQEEQVTTSHDVSYMHALHINEIYKRSSEIEVLKTRIVQLESEVETIKYNHQLEMNRSKSTNKALAESKEYMYKFELARLTDNIKLLEKNSKAAIENIKREHSAELARLMRDIRLLEHNSKEVIEDNKREYLIETRRLTAIIHDLQNNNSQLMTQHGFYQQAMRVKFHRFYDDMMKAIKEMVIGTRMTCLNVIKSNFQAAGLGVVSLESPRLYNEINIWLGNYLNNTNFNDKDRLYSKYF